MKGNNTLASIKSLTDTDIALLNTLAALNATSVGLAVETSYVSAFDARSVDAIGKAFVRLFEKGFVSRKPKKGKKGGYGWYLNSAGRKFAGAQTGTSVKAKASYAA